MDRRLIGFVLLFSLPTFALSKADQRQWVRVKARTSAERTHIVNQGISIETVASDYVIGIGTPREIESLQKENLVLEVDPLKPLGARNFPSEDAAYHNYEELTKELESLARANPELVRMDSIGKSVEGRDLWHLILSTDPAQSNAKAGIVFMGGHHAREHLSVEIPLLLAKRLITEFNAGNAEVVRLLTARQVHIIPSVNPDGAEYDISDSDYLMWRKNRGSVEGELYGIDLNRNYSFQWGGPGSSSYPSSEIYRGPKAFSEPETQAIKKFVEKQVNLTTLLSFHTFSELILYPWGHKDDHIEDSRSYQVHKAMAEKMAEWNGYTPMQSSDLYLASGDTTDWSYGEHNLVSFTFELDPRDMFSGGFYPGADAIDVVSEKNWRPALYLIEYADNPYRVIEPTHVRYGLSSALIQ